MIFFRKVFISVATVVFLIIFVLPTYAALVPCGDDLVKNPCKPCHFFLGFKNLIDFIVFTLTPPAAFVMIVASGLILIFGGSESAKTMGKKMFTSVVIGLIIIYASWLIVNTIMYEIGKNLGGITGGNWYSWNFGCQ